MACRHLHRLQLPADLRSKCQIGSAKSFLSIPQLRERINLLKADVLLSLSIKRILRTGAERWVLRDAGPIKKKRKQNIGFTSDRDLMRKRKVLNL